MTRSEQKMDPRALGELRRRNLLQSAALLVGMGGLLALLAGMFAGASGVALALAVTATAAIFAPRLSPWMVLRMFRGVPLDRARAPALYDLLSTLSRRAGLSRLPTLYYIPSPVMNAFAVGTRGNAAIGLTDGLLRGLTFRELAGVLAHELAHVRCNDMWVLGLADLMSRVTHMLALFGQLLLLVNLPLIIMGKVHVSFLLIFALIASPVLSGLLQLALSRTREYEADRGAVTLTGDPLSLARALEKMTWGRARWLRRLLLPGREGRDPSVLRSHPATGERVRRLMEMAPPEQRPLPAPEAELITLLRDLLEGEAGPPAGQGWRWPGGWY